MNRFKRNTVIAILLLMAMTSLSLVIAAEETEATEETDTEVSQTDTSNEQPTRSSPNITFTPTEEISEDLPVSFPADI